MSKHSSSGSSWQKIRLAVLDRDSHICVYCGNDATQVDHILARANGGTDDMSNLVASCQPCNIRKSDKHAPRIPYVNKQWLDKL